VFQLCLHRDSASLSRAHSSLRDVADYVLYSYIRSYSFNFPQLILETLATNMRKSPVVKVLEVEYDSYELQSLEIMAGMLPNMLNLCKLRISVEDIRRSGVSGGINQAIRFVCIQANMISRHDY
jgi:hypothetical protein